MKSEFNIEGMTCASCQARIEKAVKKLESTEFVAVNLLTNKMTVRHKNSSDIEKIIEACEAAGYGASLASKEITEEKQNDIKSDKKLKDKNLKNKIKDGLDKIKDNYTVGERKTGDLKGFWSLDIFYNKTNYEICYEVKEEEGRIIIVVMIGTRENFYKELKRYIDD